MLAIDHFYISISKEQFRQVKEELILLEDVEHKVTVRPDFTYEGIYLKFDNNTYFEVLCADCDVPVGTIGIAISDLENNDKLTKVLKSNYSSSEKLETEDVKKEGKKWFKYMNKPFKPDLYLWSMQYFDSFLTQRIDYCKKSQTKLVSAVAHTTLTTSDITSRLELGKELIEGSNISFIEVNASDKKKLSLKFIQKDRTYDFVF